MKLALISMIFVSFCSAFADQPIPSDQLKNYVQPVDNALLSENWKACTYTDQNGTVYSVSNGCYNSNSGQYGDLRACIASVALGDMNAVGSGNYGASGMIEGSTGQQTLTFSWGNNVNAGDPIKDGDMQFTDEMLLSTDGKSIIQFIKTEKTYQNFNVGTIINPSYVKEWVTTTKYECK